jgi:hypothetical protein
MTLCSPEIFGADPANITWQVVRGDTATIRVEFLDDDEVTYYDTTGWRYAATTYDFRGDVLDELTVTSYAGYVDIVAPSDITEFWGVGFRSTVTELAFDLQVTIDSDTVWTPVIGTIRVLADVTSGSL